MGGIDKGLVPLAGRPLVAWALQALRPQVATLLINANRSLDDYQGFGVPVVADRHPGFAGPLAGLHAALATAGTDYLLAVPCDTPRLPPDLGVRLGRALEAAGAEIAVVEAGGRLQPLHVLLRTGLAADLAAALARGVRKPDEWYATRARVKVNCDDIADAFANVNAPAELEALEAALRRAADQPPI